MKGVFILFLLIAFQVSAGTWNKRSNFGGIGRHRAVGASVNNRGYLGLGHVNGTGLDISYKDWWEYDPSSDSWTQRADFPVANHGAMAFSAVGCVFVGGGSALNGEFFKFNPLTNTWTPIAICPVSPGDVQAFSVNDKGYVMVGTSLVEYDPVSNTWQMKATVPVAVNAWSASFSIGSSGFVKTGVSFLEYKPEQNIWINRAPFPGIMAAGSYGFTADNEGYLTCGYYSGLSNVTDEVWKYNPGSNQWTQVETFPGTNRRFPVAFDINGKGYFGTGTNGINMNDFWQYDPSYTLDLANLENLKILIYPNPFVDHLNLEVDEELVGLGIDYRITDVLGRIYSNGKVEGISNPISVSDLNSGVYILDLIYGKEKIKSSKILRN